jgi:acetyl-CoA synthetase
VIRKDLLVLASPPNLGDYAAVRRSFSWDYARAMLDGLPSGGLNIAHEAVDRHVEHGRGDVVALRCLDKRGNQRDISYAELRGLSNKFANLLDELGVRAGQRVYSLLGRVPELYAAVLGTLKHRSVFCPLFAAFGPEPVHQRMSIGEACVLVTTPTLYRRKVAPIRAELPSLRHVLLLPDKPGEDFPEGTLDLRELLNRASDNYAISPTGPEDMALLHFTSGTTGKPKGAVHVHEAVVAHAATGYYALDFKQGDVYWCTADPGWVTGTSYGIVSPLVHGVTVLVDEAEFDASRWYRTLQDQAVTIWYTAPTAIRMLMKAGIELARQYSLPSLRFVASVGEPLNPEGVVWGQETLGLPIHDNWWQTETGGIMIANFLSMDIRPGSMGQPLPGIEAAIVEHDEGTSAVRVMGDPGQEGELALRAGWPSMFRGYLHDEERYAKCFADGWYLTGDLARRDEDGYFWFVGRADDVIKSAGHLIGPFEVESALMEHAAVAEAGVIGKPDPVAGAIVKAFVSLKSGFEPSEELRLDVLALARRRLGPAVAPREIEFVDSLPRTRSGKVLRRLLKARELSLPEGDISTLEEPND